MFFKKIFFSFVFCFFTVFLFLCFFNFAFAADIPAFPGAEGMGAYAIGGRGGEIYKVTNLNDSGSGSFREACEASGSRIVVFEVSGIINLKSTLEIRNPYITIAGQTSPGGVLISGEPVRFLTHDVIVTHMRFRKGSHECKTDGTCETQGEAVYIGNGYNIIFDHCSMSWGTDETVQIGNYWGDISDVTLSWCTLTEGLANPHPEMDHGYGLLLSAKFYTSKAPSLSVHHSYLSHFQDRIPEVVGGFIDFRNNVVYDWYHSLSPRARDYNGLEPKANWIHNYCKPGVNTNPAYPDGNAAEIMHQGEGSNILYVEGNLGMMRDSQDDDEWCVVRSWSGELLSTDYRKDTPWETSGIPITTENMSLSYAEEILESVGATKPFRDSVDDRIVSEFNNSSGDFRDDVVYPDDFPSFQNLSAPTDSDNDGMADSWEVDNGLDIGSNDSNFDKDSDGYTNIEEYLHSLAGYSNNTGSYCGDGSCNGSETCSTCPSDCGECSSCADGETRSCDTGLQGICSEGTQTCSNGDWGTCEQNNQSTTEICGDGIDQDCDGSDLSCDDPSCGDGTCDTGETCSSCPSDCGECSLSFSKFYEAEAMNLLSPFKKGNDQNASRGSYIYAVNGSESFNPQEEALMDITIPETDAYYLWARMYGPSSDEDALYIGFNEIWDRVYPEGVQGYEWVRVEISHQSNNYGFELDEGTHVLRVGHGEIGARIDNFFITNDFNQKPTDCIQGDLNQDGYVNSMDWSQMRSHWFTNNTTSDLNNDGTVNSLDFSIMNQNWTG